MKNYDAQQTEHSLQQQWYDNALYQYDPYSTKPSFSIDTPPPTVSGSLHIGHVFSYTHTDITARYKRMQGHNVFYTPCFDDNGLATERFVEKKRSIRAHQVGRSEFITMCLEETALARKEFAELWQRLGFSMDFSKSYSTISPIAQKISQTSFLELYKKEFIYRRFEPAPYCCTCRTSVAQAELEDAQQSTIFYDIAFELEDASALTIATTRPEFLASCRAVFYHPDDTRYTHLKGKYIKVPLFDRHVPILEESTIQPDKGTGLVMCCAFGDKHDVEWIKKHNLEYSDYTILDLNGKMNARAGFLSGLSVQEARARTVEKLLAQGSISAQKPLNNTINVHERCKKAIEYQALSQWFIKILPYKDQLLAFADSLAWYPDFMRTRLVHWIESLGWDWCISRQRFYGIAFPVWHCNACKAVLYPQTSQLPLDPQETSLFDQCTTCGSTDIIPDTDVMDTWNTSSLTPQLCMMLAHPELDPCNAEQIKKFLPMSIRPQAHDIIRTWTFDTLVKSWMHYTTVLPWKEVIISGHVLAESNQKISKSQSNSKMDPASLLTTHSADAVRYWTACAKLGHDVAFSESQLRVGNRLVTKLWNAFKFVQEHAHSNAELPEHLELINQWIVQSLKETQERYHAYWRDYEAGLALQVLEDFFWKVFCDNYLEIIKHQLFNPALYNAKQVEQTKRVLGYISFNMLQLFGPYVVHITDALYQSTFKKDGMPSSIHLTHYSTVNCSYPNALKDIEIILLIIDHTRRYKTTHQLSLKAPLSRLRLKAEANKCLVIKAHETILKGLLHITHLECDDNQEQEIIIEQ